MNKKISFPIAIVIIAILAVIVGGSVLAYQYWWLPKEEAKNVVCTMEAKVCPDGSAVGRTGPNCEFAPCPVNASDEMIANNSTLKLDLASYQVSCMVAGCEPNYAPTSVEQLTLKVGDKFGTAEGYESGTLFQLTSFDNSKIIVKLVEHISPLVNHTLVKVGSDSQFTFSNSACFTLNNWVDSVPSFCLARSSANINLNFDVISNLVP
jgi:hypothetical protein